MTIARAVLAVLVVGAYGTVAASPFTDVPLAWVLGYLAVYATAITASVCFLPLGTFLDVIARLPAPGAVALTFDDGPHPEHTPRVLAALDAAGAKGTFFVIGRKAAAHPEIVARIVAGGHEVGVHSYSHDHHLYVRPEPEIERELVETCDVVERAAGIRPTLFRPPIGFSSPRTRAVVHRLGMRVVGWSARAYDGVGAPAPEVLLARLEPDLSEGAVVLLHDAAERGDRVPGSLAALPGLLERLRARGFTAVTVSQGLAVGERARRELARPAA